MSCSSRFTLGPLLGSGGMGRVFEAQVQGGERIALKLLKPDFVEQRWMLDRFEAEARMAASVVHPNVVRVIEHGICDGLPFIAMELATGAPLGVMLQAGGPLPLARIARIAPQILAGLAAIHRAGVVHGDLKSDNVLVDGDDRVTIIDFGLARASGCDAFPAFGRTRSGTPEYLAPEVVRNEPFSPSADLYAAAVVLYEMLTGTTPFTAESVEDLLAMQVHAAVEPPSHRCPDRELPAALEEVVLRALAKAPSRRYADADDFAAAFALALPKPRRATVPMATAPTVLAPRATTLPPPYQVARGTSPVRESREGRSREQMHRAMADGRADDVQGAALRVVAALLEEHRLAAAAGELEHAIAWFADGATGVDPLPWRLLLTLAAVRDGTGDHAAAIATTHAALDAASRASSSIGCERSRQLLRRLEVAAAQHRAHG